MISFRHLKPFIVLLVLGGVAFLALSVPGQGVVVAQQATGSVPTVTSTVIGPQVTVYIDLGQIDVYAGPSTYLYPAVGILVGGQSAPALGRARDSEFIQIYYPGIPGSVAWVYAPYVSLSPGARLQFIDPPPTPTPFSTPTIDSTLAAAFIAPETPTRLATFTAPAPIVVPTFVDNPTKRFAGVPLGLMIFSLGFIGGLGALISYLRGR